METIASHTARELLPASASAGDLGELIQTMDPLQFPEWDRLIAGQSAATFFHGSAWARVLQNTYGHRPFYFGRIVKDRLESLLPVMEVSSPLTGRRGVSLPFTDFCAPLRGNDSQVGELYEAAVEKGKARGWRYLESRSDGSRWPGSSPSLAFWGHALDLTGSPEALFDRMEGAVRRGIRKAEAAHLQIEFADSEPAMRMFFRLHAQTRKRHGLPPQPLRFFQCIVRHVLERGSGFIVLARLEQQPVAAAVFHHHSREALYKFGASDYSFQHLRPNNLLMWEAMKKYAQMGMTRLHLGRTSVGNEGLRRFKLGFGAQEEKIEYCKYDFRQQRFISEADKVEGWFNRVFRALPTPLLNLAGRILYPHLS